MESRYIHKRHNVSVLMYHVVCAAKYRRVVNERSCGRGTKGGVCGNRKALGDCCFWRLDWTGITHTFSIQSVADVQSDADVTTVKSVDRARGSCEGAGS